MPTISVALATYNGERYLKAQLESLAKQTAAPSELIVSDDDSSDGTMTIVDEFAKNASFPVRISQNRRRLGYRRNFMQAAAACTSDLIAFCDQDDIWHHDKLGIMGKAFDDPNVLLAYHNAMLINESGGKIGRIFYGSGAKTYGPLALRPWTIIPGHAQVVRRTLVRFTPLHATSIDPYSPRERMPHDLWYPFWASVLGSVAYCPDALAQYRLHGTNVSGWPVHVLAYIVDHIRNAEPYIGGNAIGAKNRLELLQQCGDLLTLEEVGRIAAAVPYYQALSVESDRRHAVYTGKSVAARARALMALLGSGAYTGATLKALGLDALLLDAFIGVPFSQLGRSRDSTAQPAP